ncbi:MAG: STAS domain-containing protein [Planctomycetota bacterium]
MSEESFIKSYVVDDDVLVVQLHGSFDGETVPEFNEVVSQHFSDGRAKIIIDCAHLGYINSSAVGSLVMLQTRLRRKGGEVKLAALQGLPADVIKLVRLDRLLDIYGDTAFAREAFTASS